MSVNFVQTPQLLGVNGVNLMGLNYTTGVVGGQVRNISCVGTTIIGAFWRIPVTAGGILTGVVWIQAVDAVKPVPDAVKVLRLKWERETYDLAILDSDYVGSTNNFGDLCDGLGGTLAVMPTVTIPFPIIQDAPVTTAADGTKTFVFAFPSNPLGLTYQIPWPWFNGAAPVTPFVPAGITTAAQFVTWADSNWSDYGNWSSSGDIVTLASATTDPTPVTACGMSVSLAPATFCMDLTAFSTPAAVNGIKFGTGGNIRSFGAFMLTDTNAQTLINAMKPLFDENATFAITTTKIEITTVLNTPIVVNDTTPVVTASAGAC